MLSDEPWRLHTLSLPGWLDSDASHWQSRWEALHGFRRVQQADWVWPRRGDWMARLDEALLTRPSPALLVAHSLGCQLAASWAAQSRHTVRVVAAFLVAPPDTERTDMPPNLFNWRPITRQRLPFTSRVMTSSDDPYCLPERSAQIAAEWGSAHVDIGAHGHINGDSGLHDWPEGLALFRSFAQRVR